MAVVNLLQLASITMHLLSATSELQLQESHSKLGRELQENAVNALDQLRDSH